MYIMCRPPAPVSQQLVVVTCSGLATSAAEISRAEYIVASQRKSTDSIIAYLGGIQS